MGQRDLVAIEVIERTQEGAGQALVQVNLRLAAAAARGLGAVIEPTTLARAMLAEIFLLEGASSQATCASRRVGRPPFLPGWSAAACGTSP